MKRLLPTLVGLLLGFLTGMPSGALVDRHFQHGPWVKSGENRGQAVDRIEAKLNEVCGKGKMLRYEIFTVDDGFSYPYARNGCFYRIVTPANDEYTEYRRSFEGIMREVDRQEMSL